MSTRIQDSAADIGPAKARSLTHAPASTSTQERFMRYSNTNANRPDDEAFPENKTMFQAFEWYCPADHKHWQRLANAVPQLAALGISKMWIPPACKAGWHNTNGYDVYDLYDLGEFDWKGARHTKWGTKEELVALTEKAAFHGIKILFDAVLNHKAAADFSEEVMATQVDPKDRAKIIGKPELIEAWTGFSFPARGDLYSPLKWNKSHFTGIDYDHKTKTKAVWIFEGKQWAHDVDEELGNYDYLMFADIDHNNPEVRRDIFHWVHWLSTQLRLGGLRLDAIKHYSTGFLGALLEHIDQTVGPDWFIVGEYWREDSDVLAKYIDHMDRRISLFDVRLVNNFSRLSFRDNADLRTVFDGCLVLIRPTNAVTFVANHDTMEEQPLAAPIAPFFVPLAYALILLRTNAGIPCVFYGDLYGHPSADGRKFAPPACGGKVLPKLMLARKLYAYGAQTDYFDDPHCLGWTRQGHSSNVRQSGLAVVMTNGWELATKKMYVGQQHRNEIWTDLLNGCWGEINIDNTGHGVFPVGPRSVAVWVHRSAQRREEVDALIFDNNIYNLKQDVPVTADDLYKPRLETTPIWLNKAQDGES